ncbi:MAG: hypothetical protein VSS75_005650 [Candidatus Parabeggiatoa sp.]|nr:hypothetical protein [Candidatus Parabeggiatoa sp.]
MTNFYLQLFIHSDSNTLTLGIELLSDWNIVQLIRGLNGLIVQLIRGLSRLKYSTTDQGIERINSATDQGIEQIAVKIPKSALV